MRFPPPHLPLPSPPLPLSSPPSPPPHGGSRVKAALPSYLPSPCLQRLHMQLCPWDHSDALSHHVALGVYDLLPPMQMGSPLSLLFCPGCTWKNMGDVLGPNSAHTGPTLTLPEAFVNRLESKRLGGKKIIIGQYKNTCVNIFQNVISLYLSSRKKNF